YPSDHPEQQLAGKEVTFHVAVKEIKRKEVSPLDDEFARDVSEFDTLEELKEDLRSKLEEDAARRAEAEVRRQAISFVVDKSEVEIPEVLVERQIDSYIEDLKRRAEANRVYLDEYLERRGTTLEALREEFRPEAERRVKTDLVLGAIAKKEGIRVSEEEIEEKIKEMAERYRQQPEVMRKIIESQVGGLESIKDELLISKAIDLLVREARVVEES
ncbi:MAG: trigger factor, partial [Clostridia bacterium]|nr:trigger factor [Clostridia bacterium]